MTLTETMLIIIAVALCILVLTLIPTILAVKRTAGSVRALHEMLLQELKPTIQDLAVVVAELKIAGGGVAEHTDDVKRFMSALGETGDNLHTINRSVRVVATVLNTTSAWTAGIKVAGKYMLERYLKKRGGK